MAVWFRGGFPQGAATGAEAIGSVSGAPLFDEFPSLALGIGEKTLLE